MSFEITTPVNLNDQSFLFIDANNNLLIEQSNQELLLALSRELGDFNLFPNGVLICNGITNTNKIVDVENNLTVSTTINTNSLKLNDNLSGFNTILTVPATIANSYTVTFPNNYGLNGDLLTLMDDFGQTMWQTPAIQLFNSAVRIASIVNNGSANYGIKLVPSANVQYFTPNAPIITITNLGGATPDILNVPVGCTILRMSIYTQLQFSPFASATPRTVTLVANTNSGSLSRNVSSSVLPGTNNWRLTLNTELQGLTTSANFSILWGFAPTVVTFNTGFISVQYYQN